MPIKSLKFPTFNQWKQVFTVFNRKEKITFWVTFFIALGALIVLLTSFYLANTTKVPAFGGSYTEGIVGQPRLINPIYGDTNDVDRSIMDLVFSGLMTYNGQGKLIKDLAKDYQVSPDGKVYDVQLKDNVSWHDGKPLTADDIVFTINTIQNSDYKSPLRANWLNVAVQKISEKSVRFILRTPYNSFLENLTVKILPQHIWQNIPPENFTLSPYNLQPVGSGPYKFANITENALGLVSQINLQSNRKYYNRPSYIANLSFKFFATKEELASAANSGEIDGFSVASINNNENEAKKMISQGSLLGGKFSTYSFVMPRYFAVFFNNQKTSLFSDLNIRKAMEYAVNKDDLVAQVNDQTGSGVNRVDSPILPEFYNYGEPSAPYNFDMSKAGNLLDQAGFKDDGSGIRVKPISKKQAFQFTSYLKAGSKGSQVTQLQSCLVRLDDSFKTILQNETSGNYTSLTENAVTEFQKKYLPDLKPTGETGASTRQKLNELCFTQSPNSQPFAFTITTADQPELVRVANILKTQWEAVGAAVTINAVSVTDLKPLIKSRSYDALLYGEALGAEPDLYPFWHSSQIVDPGLNLSSYQNKNADKLLEDARKTLDASAKQQDYEQLEDIIISDAPAVFLYNPMYWYWTRDSIKGIQTSKIIDPAKRFSNITSWYLKTKRIWK